MRSIRKFTPEIDHLESILSLSAIIKNAPPIIPKQPPAFIYPNGSIYPPQDLYNPKGGFVPIPIGPIMPGMQPIPNLPTPTPINYPIGDGPVA